MDSSVYDEIMHMMKKLASEEEISDVRSMVFRVQESMKTKVGKQEYLNHFQDFVENQLEEIIGKRITEDDLNKVRKELQEGDYLLKNEIKDTMSGIKFRLEN